MLALQQKRTFLTIKFSQKWAYDQLEILAYVLDDPYKSNS